VTSSRLALHLANSFTNPRSSVSPCPFPSLPPSTHAAVTTRSHSSIAERTYNHRPTVSKAEGSLFCLVLSCRTRTRCSTPPMPSPRPATSSSRHPPSFFSTPPPLPCDGNSYDVCTHFIAAATARRWRGVKEEEGEAAAAATATVAGWGGEY
jgi:hypothetical protein